MKTKIAALVLAVSSFVGVNVATAPAASAHVSLCKATVFTPKYDWRTVRGDGQVTCGTDTHADELTMQLSVKRDVFGPDIYVFQNPWRRRAVPTTIYDFGSGPCRGDGDYYIEVKFATRGYYGSTPVYTKQSARYEFC